MTKTEALKVSLARRLARSGEAQRIRAEAELSLNQIAAVVGVTHVTVRRWELGDKRPSGKAAVRYADLLAALRGQP
ncbi:MAG: helix-turn-helix transcriptional regulator [Actinomycetota bacterium]